MGDSGKQAAHQASVYSCGGFALCVCVRERELVSVCGRDTKSGSGRDRSTKFSVRARANTHWQTCARVTGRKCSNDMVIIC